MDAVSLLRKSLLLQILSGLQYIVGTAEITPIVLIGPKGEDSFLAGSEMQIAGDNRENTFFRHYGQQPRRNNLDAGKTQSLNLG